MNAPARSAGDLADASPSNFVAFFDNAAIFPPGSAPMPAAIRAHLAMRSSWYAACVGPFVCSAPRLEEFAAELSSRSAEISLALTVPGGPGQVLDALRLVGRIAAARLVAIEVPIDAGTAPAALARSLATGTDQPVHAYAEIPPAAVSTELAQRLSDAGVRLKLRTGGTNAAAFPTEAELAAALAAAVAAQLPFKCTAGLHHAVRHTDPATGFEHHGFLNVLLAVEALRTGAGIPAARARLAERDPAAVRARFAALTPLARAASRALFTSFGTCSVTEPLDDLVALGLVSVP